MREVVIVISDLYVSPEAPDRQLPDGVALPGLEYVARFGKRSGMVSGWRTWLANRLGCEREIASAAPATVANFALAPGATAVTAATSAPAATSVATTATSALVAATATGSAPAATSAATTAMSAPAATSAATTAMSASAATEVTTTTSASAATGTPTSTAATVWIATPVHLVAGLTSVHFDRRSVLHLPPEDLAVVESDFRRTFADTGFALRPLASGDFLLSGPQMPLAATLEPARSMGESITHDSRGAGAPALRRLGAEIEMWLHDHPVNDTRARRGELPITGLWLWGAGPTPSVPSGQANAPAAALATTAPAAATPAAPTAAAATAPAAVPPAAPTAAATTAPAAATPATPAAPAATAPAAAAPAAPIAGTAGASDAAPAAIAPGGAPRHSNAPPGPDVLFGTDAYLSGLGALMGTNVLPVPALLTDVFSYPHAQRAVLVIEIAPMLHSNPQWTFFDALMQIDRNFIAPAAKALSNRQFNDLVLVANDRELILHARDRLKFWRRTQRGLTGLQ